MFDYRDILRASSLRVTPLRQTLLEVLSTTAEYSYSVPELLQILGEQGFTPNKTTLYREIQVLHEAGLIEEIPTSGRALRYKGSCGSGHHHHHLQCSSCQRLVHIDIPSLEVALHAAQQQMGKLTGYSVTEHSLHFTGTCPDCAA